MSLFGKFVSLEQVTSSTNLSRLNFVITFDDVSKTVEKITPFLIKKKIPFVICPSSIHTNDGYGYRDKVYFIIKYLQEADIYNYSVDVFGEEKVGKYSDFSFYNFTKQTTIHPAKIIELLVDPLFKKIPSVFDIINKQRAYLNWDEIRSKYLGNPLVTIANHSYSHFEMTGLSRQEIEDDLILSSQVFYDNLDTAPEYFAVPFGGLTQSLLVDLTDILRKQGYKGCLWVTNSGNIVNHQYDKQIIHLSRIHVPSVIIRFIYATIIAIVNSKAKIVDNLSKLSKKESKSFEIIESSNIEPALTFENIVRQGKDYASSLAFFEYSYLMNPFKTSTRSAYWAVIEHNNIVSIGYNFHIEFVMDSEIIPAVYWAGWRSLPQSNKTASAFTLISSMKRELIIGFYKPNQYSEQACQSDSWLSIDVNRYIINLDKSKKQIRNNKSRNVKISSSIPHGLSSLFNIVNKKYFFSISRSEKFYKWRYDQYPYSSTKYFILTSNEKPVGFIVLLYSAKDAYVSDFFTQSTDDFIYIFESVVSFCIGNSIEQIGIETNRENISSWLEKEFSVNKSTFKNYYFFNSNHERVRGKWERIKKHWKNSRLHETQATGDVLLRS